MVGSDLREPGQVPNRQRALSTHNAYAEEFHHMQPFPFPPISSLSPRGRLSKSVYDAYAAST